MGTLLHCQWECKLVQPLWKAVWRLIKKLKIEIAFDPVIPLLGIYPKNIISQIQKDICTPVFIAALITIAKIWKQIKGPSVDEWIKKMWWTLKLLPYLGYCKKCCNKHRGAYVFLNLRSCILWVNSKEWDSRVK